MQTNHLMASINRDLCFRYTFRELLPSNSKHSFQSSYQTILTRLEIFFQTVLKIRYFGKKNYQINFPDLWQTILAFSESYF